jgi:hydroxyacylglutathione hydrolase
LLLRKEKIDEMRTAGEATVPSTLAEEFGTNPFLRPDSEGIRSTLGIKPDASNAEAFGVIRRHKDKF